MCHGPRRYIAAVAATSCGIAMLLVAAAVDAQVRGRDGVDGPRGPIGRPQRSATSVAVPPPAPPSGPAPTVDGKGNPPPGPIARLPEDGKPVNHFPGPTPAVLIQDGSGRAAPNPPPVQNKSFAAGSQGGSVSVTAAPSSPQAPAPVASPAAADPRPAISEIIPDVSYTPVAPEPQPLAAEAHRPASGLDVRTSSEGCVNVVVRSSTLDGRDVVSIDLHGDGLIKGVVPPQLARELLAGAGARSVGGAWITCVPPALAQRVFDPAINLAGFDSAARIKHVGDRWVLASSNEPDAAPLPPEQLAAVAPRTRGPVKVKAKPKHARVPTVRTARVTPKPAAKEGAVRLAAASTTTSEAQVQAGTPAKPGHKRTEYWFYP